MLIFGKQDIILAQNSVCQSHIYNFQFQIPENLLPDFDRTHVPLQIQESGSWEKIGMDIVSELTGMRQLAPNLRFFLDAKIDIPWSKDVSRSIEITINPKFQA